MTYTPPEKDWLFGDNIFGSIFGDIFQPRPPVTEPLHNAHVTAYQLDHLMNLPTRKTSPTYNVTAAETSAVIDPSRDLFARIDALEREVQQLKQLILKD